MTVEKGFPPNIEQIRAVFAEMLPTTVFTYGQTIYAQDNEVTPDILAHEQIHAYQQTIDPKAWWDRYLSDPVFRLDQEVPAYRAHWQWFTSHLNTKQHDAVLHQLAASLSGSTYGNIISYEDAKQKILS